MVGEVTQAIYCGFSDPVQFRCSIAHTDDGKDWKDDVKDGVQQRNLKKLCLKEGLVDFMSRELSTHGCLASRQQSENIQKDLDVLGKCFPFCIEKMEMFRQKPHADTGFLF